MIIVVCVCTMIACSVDIVELKFLQNYSADGDCRLRNFEEKHLNWKYVVLVTQTGI